MGGSATARRSSSSIACSSLASIFARMSRSISADNHPVPADKIFKARVSDFDSLRRGRRIYLAGPIDNTIVYILDEAERELSRGRPGLTD
jgi:hypothetical protein